MVNNAVLFYPSYEVPTFFSVLCITFRARVQLPPEAGV